jgi:hypothetical protein
LHHTILHHICVDTTYGRDGMDISLNRCTR